MPPVNSQYDAIVIGSGVTGGWAAKELTEKGLKVLMLDRGRMVEHREDYKTEHMPPWQIPLRGKSLRELYAEEYPVQSRLYAFDETTRHFFSSDKEQPYVYEPNGFLWFRPNVVGGKSLLWGRQVYRWSDLDFEANKKDGHGIDWPIRYKDLAPWYSHVEKFIGVSGQAENLSHLPDSEFLPPMDMNVAEKTVKAGIEAQFPDRKVTIGRVAHLTRPSQTHLDSGRVQCQNRSKCARGCSFGAYFSTQSSTLPAARATGNLTLKSNSVVERIDYDPDTKRATGVRVIDANSRERTIYTGRLIFLCASTIASTQILLNSRSAHFPSGLANSSGVLGRYLMDHTLGTGARGIVPGYTDKVERGNRPTGVYVPRFRNLGGESDDADFLRGYGYQGRARRLDWQSMAEQVPGFGAEFKHALRTPGPWVMHLHGFGECLPYKNNRMVLDDSRKDPFGIPQVRFHFEFRENEHRMRLDMAKQAEAMLKAGGLSNVFSYVYDSAGGEAIHEMGTARMGDDPRESVLNRWNQAHDVPNLFVTDGSCMTSSSCVNPSLTYMALTARAADYAVKKLRAGAL